MTQYKDSGLEWIGEIPVGWGVYLAKNIFNEHKQKNYQNIESNLLSLSYGKIIKKDIESLTGLIPESFSTYNIIKKDDIVLRLTDLQNDKKSLRTAICREEKGIITSAYLTLRLFSKQNATYLHYLLHTYDICKVFYNLGGGVRLGGSWGDIGKLRLILPPLQEQAAIATFLDKKTAEIDAIIDKITQQIQTLKDYRQSLITETVTKGLDKNVELKDSGIEWIGEIPVGWDVSRLKYITNFKTGGTPPDRDGIDEFNDYPWITAKDMNSFNIFQTNFFISHESVKRYNYKLFPPHSVLIVCIASIGKVSLIDKESYSNQQITALINSSCNEKFLLYSIVQQMDKIKLDALSNVIPIINTSYLSNICIPVPPLQEQAAIADYLDKKTAQIDRIIAKKEEQLSIMKEHRKSLIYEYVTGKKQLKEFDEDGN